MQGQRCHITVRWASPIVAANKGARQRWIAGQLCADRTAQYVPSTGGGWRGSLHGSGYCGYEYVHDMGI